MTRGRGSSLKISIILLGLIFSIGYNLDVYIIRKNQIDPMILKLVAENVTVFDDIKCNTLNVSLNDVENIITSMELSIVYNTDLNMNRSAHVQELLYRPNVTCDYGIFVIADRFRERARSNYNIESSHLLALHKDAGNTPFGTKNKKPKEVSFYFKEDDILV